MSAKCPIKPLTPEEELEFFGTKLYTNWCNRYPRFQLYHCAECYAVVLESHLCLKHGGSNCIKFFNRKKYISIGDKPYHRLVLGEPINMDVHHKDGNTFNNHPDNLIALIHAEHFKLHCTPTSSNSAEHADFS